MTATYPRVPDLRPLLLFGLLVLLAVFTAHAVTSHEAHISDIDRCFDGPGQLSPWYHAGGNRYLQFCNDGGKYNYFRISECQGGTRIVITQFKQLAKKLVRYLNNRTAGIADAPPPCQ